MTLNALSVKHVRDCMAPLRAVVGPMHTPSDAARAMIEQRSGYHPRLRCAHDSAPGRAPLPRGG